MRVNQITTLCIATIISVYTPVSMANHNEAGHRWVPNHPENIYWQAPEWSGNNQAPSYNIPPPQQRIAPAYNANNQAPNVSPPPPNYRPPQGNYGNTSMPRTAPPQTNMYRGYPPPRGPYQGYYGPDNDASAFNIPGYNRYRGNRWSNNKFWGRSGPRTWMNPNKRNMERGWDDMINAPSRMGTMPGGWNAPEVTMPNPVDMGDQMQDNMKDLPEQMKDMDVGNEVND